MMEAYNIGIVSDDRAGPPGRRSVRIFDDTGRPLGFIEIDRLVAGRCCGGIRASADVTADELRRIAEVMTLKCGFVGLAAGGAKGGVVMPADITAEERTARLAAFGRAAAPLLRSGVWSHGADMGTTEADIARIRHAAGVGAAPPVDAAPATGNTSNGFGARAAGLTVALCAEAAAESLGIPLRGARIALLGAGAVGRAAIRSLAERGARIVALSTLAGTFRCDDGLDVAAVLDGLARCGDAFTASGAAPGAAAASDCDVLLICAGTACVDIALAENVRARAVVCGANIPFAEGVQTHLEKRGVLILPDFVAGGGGVLGTTLASVAGITPFELEPLFRRHFKPLVAETIAAASVCGTTAGEEARRRALRVIAACEAAYGSEKPPTLLPDRLAPPASTAMRIMLALERRVRASPRVARLMPRLRAQAVARVERVLSASLAVGADETLRPRT